MQFRLDEHFDMFGVRWLEAHEPVARVGKSIRVYYIAR